MIDPKPYHIIGISPGNSYFKDDKIRFLLETLIGRFGRVGVLIPDIPAISTYRALGYPENRARRDKAIPKGNALRNKVLRIRDDLGYDQDQVRIFDWGREIEPHEKYQEKYKTVLKFYQENLNFHASANQATREVLESSGKTLNSLENSIEIGVHYLLSELAFMEFVPQFLGLEKAVYVYHKNWRIYEDYIAGKFGIPNSALGFLLLNFQNSLKSDIMT